MAQAELARHISLEAALGMGPAPHGKLAMPVFRHGSMEVELYSPVDADPQDPHDRDEIYVVAVGEGEFFDGEKAVTLQQGSFIFVPAGTPHYFQKWTPGFTVWVFFYGPKGGEARV